MSFEYRPSLDNTLQGWTNLNWQDVEFVMCDNGSDDPIHAKEVVMNSGLNVTHYIRNEKAKPPNAVWNELYKLSSGEFVIIAMQDEIISSKDIIQRMLNAYHEGERVSINTYELSYYMTEALSSVPWQSDPKTIETLPGFWTDTFGTETNADKHAAGLLMHISGQYRKHWDYFGMFHPDNGYLLVDRDVVLREKVLGKQVQTPTDVVCYHQWHRRKVDGHAVNGPTYRYFTEREARLLDEPERER